ncbi:HNH endonuclease [Gordonia malaquae]|uniref:HNH nuclease domain-containing protein n=1 Tax=Gordonia malaquae NBRC 108250 TaxID=1223542 RepID=M3VH63_GORML|nr:hypothetical protein GM1_041_00500 [Gordonia malaquae NBRC 108250]SEE25977.1 HNH endonuclease [Gordonia malaquae]
MDSTAHRIPRSRYLATREGLIIAPSGRPLKPWAGDRTGHLRVDIDLGRHFVHRLVMETFVGPCPSGMEVRHLNGEPADNRLENLAYGTRSENVLDSVAHGTYRNANSAKTHCPRGHEYVDSNVYIDPRGSRRCRACKAGEQ